MNLCVGQVMLLSLAAGGVGLNLVGANHLFMLDMHWNPQMESQACDRIYRSAEGSPVPGYTLSLCSYQSFGSVFIETGSGSSISSQSGSGSKVFDDPKRVKKNTA
jgi:hypothetical protein